MTRSLRPRNARPSYAAILAMGEEDAHGGPSSIPVVGDEGSSGNEFEPDAKNKGGGDEAVEDEDDDNDEMEEDELEEDQLEEDELIDDSPPKRKRKRGAATVSAVSVTSAPSKSTKSKAKASSVKSIMGPGHSFTRTTAKRQMYALPAPSVNHRHRAVPLFSRPGRVERLLSPPELFRPDSVAMTNGFTHSKVADWVNKSWGYNVGWGPLWELVEDRGWFKEAKIGGEDADSEAARRPRVYEGVRVKEGWAILSSEDATLYLPSDVETTEEGQLKPAPPIPCFVGPIKSQTRLDINMFDTFHMSQYIPESNAHIFSAGAPVWAIDWCPFHVYDRPVRNYKQYLAVGPFTSRSHSPEIGAKVHRPSYACVQIWSLGPSKPIPNASKGKGKQKEKGAEEGEEDKGVMRCEMVLCLSGGPAFELKWCPLPTHDELNDDVSPRKLGLLAGTFEDGSLCIYAVPQPEDITPEGHDPSQPVFVKMSDPLIRIELEETSCWTFDWANSEVIAIGTTNGIIAVYNLSSALQSCTPGSPTVTDILPTHYLTIHQSAIRALAWVRAPPAWPSGVPRVDEDPTVIASGGYDGVECMTDIREGHGCVMNRTRDVINTMSFSPFTGGPITIDHENTVKAYSASPSMLGRGHTLLEPQGPVWTVHASDYHPQLAVGSADGTCSTTNTLKSTRRGGSVPFFLHKIYQMDYNRNSKEYRMLERFLPQETTDRPTATRAAKTKKPVPIPPAGTGAWPPEVGVQRVVWNAGSGLGAAGMLASATNAGICRVDVLWGRWMKGKIPYGGVEGIRREKEVVVESEGSDSG